MRKRIFDQFSDQVDRLMASGMSLRKAFEVVNEAGIFVNEPYTYDSFKVMRGKKIRGKRK
jgi:hypothetical protein